MSESHEQIVKDRIQALERKLRRREARRSGPAAAAAQARLAIELAGHAALPVQINAELLHLLRINFFNDPPRQLPFTTEADLLLSDLFTEVGEGNFEMEASARAYLLTEMIKAPAYGQRRLKQVAALLWEYSQRRAQWGDRKRLERAQLLTALNFLDPARARSWLGRAAAEVNRAGRGEHDWLVAMNREIERIEPVQQVIAEAQAPQVPVTKQVAVVVGINAYRDKTPPFNLGSVNDALAVEKTLHERYGFATYLNLDEQATRAGIWAAITQSLNQAGPDTRWLFYFSGHAFLHISSQKTILLAHDSLTKEEKELLPLEDLINACLQSQAAEILILLDTHYYGDTPTASLPLEQRVGRVMHLISAGQPFDQVLDNPSGLSPFTGPLVAILQETARAPRGRLPFSALLRRLQDQAQARAANARLAKGEPEVQIPYGARLLPNPSGREFTFEVAGRRLDERLAEVMQRAQKALYGLNEQIVRQALKDDLQNALSILQNSLSTGILHPDLGRIVGQVWRTLQPIEPLSLQLIMVLLDLRGALCQQVAGDDENYSIAAWMQQHSGGLGSHNDVFQAIEDFTAAYPSGYFILSGRTGSGKSARMADYLQRTGCLGVCTIHADSPPPMPTPAQFLKSACAQLIVEYGLPYNEIPWLTQSNDPASGEPEIETGTTTLRQLLAEACQAAGQPVVILLDALDDYPVGYNDLQAVFSRLTNLPAGAFFVVSTGQTNSMPNAEHREEFTPRNSQQDMAAFFSRHLSQPRMLRRLKTRNINLEEILPRLAHLSEGNYNTAYQLLYDIERGDFDTILDQSKTTPSNPPVDGDLPGSFKPAAPARDEAESESGGFSFGIPLEGFNVEQMPAEPEKPVLQFRIEDHPEDEPLQPGEVYTLAISREISPTMTRSEINPLVQQANALEPAPAAFEVYVTSTDFEVLTQSPQRLRQRPGGSSMNKARFEIEPRHTGMGRLSVMLYQNNAFVEGAALTLNIGGDRGSAIAEIEVTGAPKEPLEMARRDLTLVIRQHADGFDLTLAGIVSSSAFIPLSSAYFNNLVQQVGREFGEILYLWEDPEGKIRVLPPGSKIPLSIRLPFLSGLDISETLAREAERRLAQTGFRLYQDLFYPPSADLRLTSMGDLLYQASRENRLKMQVVSDSLLLPWDLLYLDQTFDGGQIDVANFLGMHHIVEQIGLQSGTGRIFDPILRSTSPLAVNLVLNDEIDLHQGTQVVAEQLRFWRELDGRRVSIKELRTTNDVMTEMTLPDGSPAQLWNFFTPITVKDFSEFSDNYSLSLANRGSLPLRDLKMDAPARQQFAGAPLFFMNIGSDELTLQFYQAYLPYFLARGARGMAGPVFMMPTRFAGEWAMRFFPRFLAGSESIGEIFLSLRREFYEQHNNLLGLLYSLFVDSDTRIEPGIISPA